MRVLLIEDDDAIAALVVEVLAAEGWVVTRARRAEGSPARRGAGTPRS